MTTSTTELPELPEFLAYHGDPERPAGIRISHEDAKSVAKYVEAVEFSSRTGLPIVRADGSEPIERKLAPGLTDRKPTPSPAALGISPQDTLNYSKFTAASRRAEELGVDLIISDEVPDRDTSFSDVVLTREEALNPTRFQEAESEAARNGGVVRVMRDEDVLRHRAGLAGRAYSPAPAQPAARPMDVVIRRTDAMSPRTYQEAGEQAAKQGGKVVIIPD